MKIDWRPKAERDLDAIVDYIAVDSPTAAVQQGDEIYEQVMGLAFQKKAGEAVCRAPSS